MTTPDRDRPLEPGTIIANNYRVAARLGAGGMGTVYVADNITLSQRVVVKVLRGGQAGAGQEEAQMLANLQHPNVVTVYAHDPALDCIVMEFLDGASLSTLLEKGIDRINAIRVALAVAEALAAVHRRGLVHRDIKPENVMLALNVGGGGGRLVDWLKLIDFGLALKTGKTPPMLLGTPEFCGPEQFIAAEVAHPANDVYALGITIFLMLTGVFPFDVPREELPHAHLTQHPPGLVDTLVHRFGRDSFDPRTLALLEDLDELLQQMLAKKVPDRPSAQEVARRLIRLESSFAEAGTFVGSAAPPIALTELAAARRRRSSTSVLTRAHAAKTASSETSPDVQPVTTQSAPALQAVTALETPALASPSSSSELPPVSKSNLPLIIVLGLLVIALALAVVALGFSPPPVPDKPRPSLATLDVRDLPSSALPLVPQVVVDAGPVVDEALDAGASAPPDAGPRLAPEQMIALPPISHPKGVPAPVPKPRGCHYDAALEKSARLEMMDLLKGATRLQKDEIEEMGDELHEAFRTKDCRATDGVLRKMRAVVHARPR